MKIRIKNDDLTRSALLNDSVPLIVLEDLLGKTFNVVEGDLFTIRTEFLGKPCVWSIKPELTEIVEF
jgi:hypothetical protein